MEIEIQSQDTEAKMKQALNPTTSTIMKMPSSGWKGLLDYFNSNPEEIESVIEERKEEGSSGMKAPFSLIQISRGESETSKADSKGYILDLPLKEVPGSSEYVTEPQARYTQANEVYSKPDIEFDDRLKWDPSLEQIEVPSEYENASKFMNSVKNSAEWAMKTLRKIYMTLREEQHQFINTLDPATLRPFNLTDCAEEIGIDESNVSRLTRGESLEIYTGSESYHISLKELSTSLHGVRRFRAVEKINEVFEREYEEGEALSDRDIAEMADIDIARKTINKYRNQESIPVSYEREKAYEAGVLEGPYRLTMDLNIWNAEEVSYS